MCAILFARVCLTPPHMARSLWPLQSNRFQVNSAVLLSTVAFTFSSFKVKTLAQRLQAQKLYLLFNESEFSVNIIRLLLLQVACVFPCV